MDLIDRASNQPLCPLCNTGMPLVHTQLRVDADLHRFECQPCGVLFAELVQAQLAHLRIVPSPDNLNEAV